MAAVVFYDLRDPIAWDVLSAPERERVGRFGRPEAARRWAAGRAGLRLVLAKALGARAADLVLTRGPHGKPALAGSPLRFNKSDSGDLAAVALCDSREVGLDIELHREVRRSEQIARRFFSGEERAALDALPGALRRPAFFDCWTVKEAVLKCDGGGLGAIPMASYSAPLDRDWRGPIGGRWWGARLEVGPAVSAAVVLDGTEAAALEITFPTGGASARG